MTVTTQDLYEDLTQRLNKFNTEIDELIDSISDTPYAVEYYQKLVEIIDYETVLANFLIYHKAGLQETWKTPSGTIVNLPSPQRVIIDTLDRLREIQLSEIQKQRSLPPESEYLQKLNSSIDRIINDVQSQYDADVIENKSVQHIKLEVEINNLIGDWYMNYNRCKSGTMDIEHFTNVITPDTKYQIALRIDEMTKRSPSEVRLWQWNRMSVAELEYEIRHLQLKKRREDEDTSEIDTDINAIIDIIEEREKPNESSLIRRNVA